MKHTLHIAVLVCCFFLKGFPPAPAAETNMLFVPNGADASFGEKSIGIYRDTQQVYPSMAFSHAAGDELIITGVSFRRDSPTGSSVDVVIPRIQLWLSTFTGSYSELIPEQPYRHYGTDRTLVYAADNVRLIASQPNDPSEFAHSFEFQTAFVFNRSKGLLVLDFETPTSFSERSIGLDVATPPWAEPGLIITGARDGVAPTWGNGVLATRFSVIPEPKFIGIFGTGVVVILVLRKAINLGSRKKREEHAPP